MTSWPSPGPAQPPPPAFSGPPRYDPIPGTAIAAGVLGIVGCLPVAALALGLVAMTGDGGAIPPGSWLLLLVPALQLGGAVLLLCRRAWPFLPLACAPGLLLLALRFLGGGSDALGSLLIPLVELVPTGLAFVLSLRRDVRDWVGDRTRGDGR